MQRRRERGEKEIKRQIQAVSWWLRDFPWAVNQTLMEHILCILTNSPSMAVIFISQQCLANLASGKRWREGGTRSNTYSATIRPLLHLLFSALSLLLSPLLVWNQTLLQVCTVSVDREREEWRKKRGKRQIRFLSAQFMHILNMRMKKVEMQDMF